MSSILGDSEVEQRIAENLVETAIKTPPPWRFWSRLKTV